MTLENHDIRHSQALLVEPFESAEPGEPGAEERDVELQHARRLAERYRVEFVVHFIILKEGSVQ